MTAAEIERGLVAQGVPRDKARRIADGEVKAVEDRQPLATIALPFRLSVQWSLLCSDNERKTAATAKLADGKIVPRLVASARYTAAKGSIRVKARLAAGDVAPTTEPLAIRVEVWLPPARRNDAINFAKIVGDALEGIVYANDNQLHDSRWIRRGVDIDSPRAEITISPLSASPTP